MKPFNMSVAVVTGLALMATPALAGQPSTTPNRDSNPGTEHVPSTTPNEDSNPGVQHQPEQQQQPGPGATLPQKAKAYGKYCQAESKKRSDAAPGTKGTPFSQCVTAMAKLGHGNTASPRTACKGLSRHKSDAAPGTHGSPFSQCVVGGNKLLRAQRKGGSTS